MSATLEISSDHRIGFLPNEAYTDPDYLRRERESVLHLTK